MKAPVLFLLPRRASPPAAPRPCHAAPGEPGLLFHLSCDRELTVDYAAGGAPRPDFIRDVRVIMYVNGRLAAKGDSLAVVYAGLDQFGPRSRAISTMQAPSGCDFFRGGDLDGLRFSDRMLSDESGASLAGGEAPREMPPLTRDLGRAGWRDERRLRYGWNRGGEAPPYLATAGPCAQGMWIDCVDVPSGELQRARLGGVALTRQAPDPLAAARGSVSVALTGES